MLGSRIGSVLMAGVGVAHLVPATAVLSRRRIEELYGITVADPDVELLLRHRALFFGLVGVALIGSAARPRYRPPALLSGAVGLGSFVGLAYSIDGSSSALVRVARVDIGLLVALAAAAALTRRQSGRCQVPRHSVSGAR
ncbi:MULTISPECIES: hypothetical protein [unclassified Rhodococcus (in: high G+C Gram-positive bacteria)]|uniref:hypothetical protein n=1 Tax=Rhodococcus sp. SJ-3 TaxID=3454628 RepID=UPI002D8F3ADA|nr:hypothetical protein [Rhodococcus sp. (in: high G+C Gram-positive bacteria)]